MPVQLKKPFNPGDADPKAGDGYPHAQLTAFHHNGLTMAVAIEYEFGTASGEYYQIWERGPASPVRQRFVQGADVAEIWAEMPKDGECVGEAIRRCTYEYLIKTGELDGTIQNNPPLPPAAAPVEPTAEPASGTEPAADTPPGESAEPAPVEQPATETASESSSPDESGSDAKV